VQVEHPVWCGYAPAFHFHTTLAGMLSPTLMGDQIIEVCQSCQNREDCAELSPEAAVGGEPHIAGDCRAHLAIAQGAGRQDCAHGAARGALDPPTRETTQSDTHIMGVAGQAPAAATGRLVGELQAKGQETGKHRFDKRFAIAKQLILGRCGNRQ
jgi:hypothetical protein